MALSVIKGRNVGLYLAVPGPTPTYKRIRCANSISFEVTTEAVDTDCQDEDDDSNGNFASSEPGQISWTAKSDMTTRLATDVAAGTGGNPPAETDATDNITAENLLDAQLAGSKFLIRYQLGTAVGSPRYQGTVYITGSSFSSDNKTNGKDSVSFQGTGPLGKTLVPA